MIHTRSRAGAAVVAVALSLGASAVANAQNVTPNFGTAVPTATTDRYAPTTFDLTNGTNGRNDVLNIGITAATDFNNRPPAYQDIFYNTQGKTLATSATGSWTLTSDLWVDASWENGSSTNLRRSDMWGVGVDGAGDVSNYMIIGFTNYDPIANAPTTGTFRGWDEDVGPLGSWVNFTSTTVNYDAWNTLAITFDAGTHTFDYFVNGGLAASIIEDPTDGTVGIKGDIMQAYNFNDPEINPVGHAENTDYTALWSNTPATTATPEPASIALMATGLFGVVGIGYKKRRNS